MIITCPSCSTQYSIDRKTLGNEGRTVRCSHCGTSWWQPVGPVRRQEHALAGSAMAEVAAASRGPVAGRPAAAVVPPEPEVEPEIESEPISTSEPWPEPEPEPEPAFASAAMEAAAEESAAIAEVEEPEPSASGDEDVDRPLIAESEPAAAESPVDGEKAEETAVDADHMPDSEPIPDVFTAFEIEEGEERGGRKGLWIALVTVVLLVAGGAGLYFGRGMVVSMWPGAASLYSMVGVDAERLGAGLELTGVRNEWVTEGGHRDLVVSGVIANISNRERLVPMLRIEMRDAHDAVVQVYVYPPEKTRLPAGGRLDFKAQVGEVMATARRVHVLFTDQIPPDQGKAPSKPAS